jgi:hypothetical protein
MEELRQTIVERHREIARWGVGHIRDTLPYIIITDEILDNIEIPDLFMLVSHFRVDFSKEVQEFYTVENTGTGSRYLICPPNVVKEIYSCYKPKYQNSDNITRKLDNLVILLCRKHNLKININNYNYPHQHPFGYLIEESYLDELRNFIKSINGKYTNLYHLLQRFRVIESKATRDFMDSYGQSTQVKSARNV